LETDGVVGLEVAVAVGDRHAGASSVDAGQSRDDVMGGVRDQGRVVIAADDAVVLKEVQEIRHLLEI
jgi:hypothetical protein